MGGVVKIGMRREEEMEKGMKELYRRGVGVGFECKFGWKVKKSECVKIEKGVDKGFEGEGMNEKGELLCMKVEEGEGIVEVL